MLTGDPLFVNGEVTVPTLLRFAHLVLGVWLTAWLLLWRVAEPCLRSWGSGRQYCSMSCNSRKGSHSDAG